MFDKAQDAIERVGMKRRRQALFDLSEIAPHDLFHQKIVGLSLPKIFCERRK
jgi:hypothetical protein